jgi:hypothetical protein
MLPIVIAGYQCFDARQVREQAQADVEVRRGAEVAAENQQIDGVAVEVAAQQLGRIVATLAMAPVQIGGDCDAHDKRSEQTISCCRYAMARCRPRRRTRNATGP